MNEYTLAKLESTRLIAAIDRLTAAVEKKHTVVPIIVYIPQNVSPDRLREMTDAVLAELRKAGFDLPSREETNDNDDE